MAGKFKPFFLHDKIAQKMKELKFSPGVAELEETMRLMEEEFQEMQNHGPDPLGIREPFCSGLAGCVRNETDKGDDTEF